MRRTACFKFQAHCKNIQNNDVFLYKIRNAKCVFLQNYIFGATNIVLEFLRNTYFKLYIEIHYYNMIQTLEKVKKNHKSQINK